VGPAVLPGRRARRPELPRERDGEHHRPPRQGRREEHLPRSGARLAVHLVERLLQGIDLGYQIITSTKSTFDLPPGMSAQDRQDLEDAANHLGKIGFPIVSLLQLGFYL
jgi:hypothetical protein